MCVIFSCKEGIPADESILTGEECNPDGGGIAWIERDKTGEPLHVRWEKGLSGKEVLKTLHSKGVKTPLQIHFRVGTVGGKVAELTHPFPVEREGGLATEGKSQATLMHNGHWRDWEEALFWTMLSRNGTAPTGAMSDSRALSLIVAHHGYGILDLMPMFDIGKISILHTSGIYVYGNNWIDFPKAGYKQSSAIFQGGRKKCVVTNEELTKKYSMGYSRPDLD